MSGQIRAGHVIALRLQAALTVAGHSDFHKWATRYDVVNDNIIVRFDADDRSVCFTMPAETVDPVAYAQAKWPEWFVKQEEEQLWR